MGLNSLTIHGSLITALLPVLDVIKSTKRNKVKTAVQIMFQFKPS